MNNTIAVSEMLSRVIQDHARWRGRRIQVFGAYVGNGDDSLGYRDFAAPLTVVVIDRPLPAADITEATDGGQELLDVCYAAQLVGSHPDIDFASGEHVIWVDGPTYYFDGRTIDPSWMSIQSGKDDLPSG